MFHVYLKKNVYYEILGWNVLYLSIRCIRSTVSFKANVFLLIFCLHDLSVDVCWSQKSPTIIVLLSISPFVCVNICFIYLDAPMLVLKYL